MGPPARHLPDKDKSRQMATVLKTASRRAAPGEKRNMLRNWCAGGGIRSSDRARLRENSLLQAGLDGGPGAWGWWGCKLSGKRTGARMVEWARLEGACGSNVTVGSNPTLSAIGFTSRSSVVQLLNPERGRNSPKLKGWRLSGALQGFLRDLEAGWAESADSG